MVEAQFGVHHPSAQYARSTIVIVMNLHKNRYLRLIRYLRGPSVVQDKCALRRDVDLAVDNDGVYAAIGGAG